MSDCRDRGFALHNYAVVGVAIFYSCVHSALDEYCWRWFVFASLRHYLGMPAAVVLASCAFSAHHIVLLGRLFGYDSPLTWSLVQAISVGGAWWCWMYARYGSILGA